MVDPEPEPGFAPVPLAVLIPRFKLDRWDSVCRGYSEAKDDLGAILGLVSGYMGKRCCVDEVREDSEAHVAMRASRKFRMRAFGFAGAGVAIFIHYSLPASIHTLNIILLCIPHSH
jgi:hypothetical protein